MYVELVESKQRKHDLHDLGTSGLVVLLSSIVIQSAPLLYRFEVWCVVLVLVITSYESSPIPSKRRTRCQVGLDCANTIVPYTHSFENFNR